VRDAGGRLVVARRLIDDQLFDTNDGALRARGTALRLRRAGPDARLTWKGPTQPGEVKIREELETGVSDAAAMDATLHALGYEPSFRSQKYREEYVVGTASVTVDETPAGVFVEIEAAPEEIARVSSLLGRTRADYRLESYVGLWRDWCTAHGRPFGDMLFEPAP
jgi:adenylate cyclase class 2